MKAKNKKTIFVCQVAGSVLKVVKCLLQNNSKEGFVAQGVEIIPDAADEKEISAGLAGIFKKLGYNRNPIIISLPRNQATCRYLKIPAQAPNEIRKIVSLQAPKYLPYPSSELVTAFQVASTDEQGFSFINMTVAHKDTIERCLKIFKEFRASEFNIALSSYGLVNIYNYLRPDEAGPVMILDIDSEQAELAIVSAYKKLNFSRSFKLSRSNPDWRKSVAEEINKSLDAYLKEVSAEAPHKIFLVGTEETLTAPLPVEFLSYSHLVKGVFASEYSVAGLIGLGLDKIDNSLSLLPEDIKKEAGKTATRNKRLRIGLFISGVILLLAVGIAKDLDNKKRYLVFLKAQVENLAKEAQPLEEIEKRMGLLQKRSQGKTASLEFLYELHQIIPPQISLVSLNYEEDAEIILRGQTEALNSVLEFVSRMEKSAVFRKFNVKVQYATAKKTRIGEIVDFEILCRKK